MAIINSKEDVNSHIDSWREAFRKSFNSIRIFNAHQATYKERIELLEALKHIDQEWSGPLEKVIQAFKTDWQGRNEQVAEVILKMISDCISHTVYCPYINNSKDFDGSGKKMIDQYTATITLKERDCHRKIRSLFKHNIFQLELPPQSILHQDLFSRKTWEFLGLNHTQIVLAGGISGAVVGAGLDIAAAGLSFGVFSTIGGIIGALSTMAGGKQFFRNSTLFGVPLTSERLQVGPNTNAQFLFILLDRALLYYSHVINWAHGKRDYPDEDSQKYLVSVQPGITRTFNPQVQQTCISFFKKVSAGKLEIEDKSISDFSDIILDLLSRISIGDGK